jgi:hypothetical protein
MISKPVETPSPPSPTRRLRLGPGCLSMLVAVLALVIAFVILCPSQLFAQILIQRAWPLHLYQTSSRHYHVLAAPFQMARPSAVGPSRSAINAAGQVLVTNFSRTTLWSPPNVDTASDQVVDFQTIFDIPRATGSVIASGLNDYGQVAGVVQASDSEAARPFLWTPQHANGSEGVITYLTHPSLQRTRSYVWGLNDDGQIIFEQDNESLLWIPDAPNSTHGTAQPIRPDGSSGKVDLRASTRTVRWLVWRTVAPFCGRQRNLTGAVAH